MTWTTPKIEDLNCGMEINMYFPADGDDPLRLTHVEARESSTSWNAALPCLSTAVALAR